MTTNNDSREQLRALDASAAHHDVAFDGGTMRWRRFGAGRPLVLVHGGHGSWLHWVRNIAALSSAHELWIPDLPGYGDSSALPREAGIERMVDIVVDAIDTLLGARSGIL